MLPYYPVPRNKGMEDISPWNEPKVQELKHEVLIASIFMFLVPAATFIFMQEKFDGDELRDTYAALAAVFAT